MKTIFEILDKNQMKDLYILLEDGNSTNDLLEEFKDYKDNLYLPYIQEHFFDTVDINEFLKSDKCDIIFFISVYLGEYNLDLVSDNEKEVKDYFYEAMFDKNTDKIYYKNGICVIFQK